MKHIAHKIAIHQGFSAINATKFELPLKPDGIRGVACGSFKYAVEDNETCEKRKVYELFIEKNMLEKNFQKPKLMEKILLNKFHRKINIH